MKLITTTIGSLVLGMAIASHTYAAPAQGTYAFDPAHSRVGFAIDHLGYTDVVGQFRAFDGDMKVDAKGKSIVNVNIKTASVDTNHEKRDQHLRSPDFFNAKQFPVIKLSGPISTSGDKLTAEMTMLGVKKPIELIFTKGKEGKDPWGNYRIGYSATGTINRADFGMDFMKGNLSDEVTISVNFEAVKK